MSSRLIRTQASTKEVAQEDNSPSNTVRSQQQSVPRSPWDSDVLIRARVQSWIPGKSVALVKIGEQSESLEPAYYVAGSIFSGLLGLRMHVQPEVGSEVLILRSENKNENYIIGTLSGTTGDAGSMHDQNTDTVADTPARDVTSPTAGYDQQGDITARMDRVGGEFDLLNAQNVGMSFLQNLVRLRASELSAVECHLMDDLVRIISDNFQHVSAFGDYTIKNDGGRPTVIWKGSSKLHETEGREGPNEEMGDPENWLETKAKARFQSYVGHLGNMVHVFVTEPQDTLNKVAAGRFRAHVNEDGSFLMQSFGDIAFEKTFAVQVPVQQYLEDDPEGDQLADMEYQPHASLQDWVPGDDEFFYEAYKIRDYARWLNNWYSLAQYHRSTKDYRVPSESENRNALSKDLNNDPERPNTGLDAAHNFYVDVYSTVRIFKDGSILLYDGYASTVHLGGGHVTVSASKDLNLEAARDLNITAGRDMTVKSYRNFDLAALTGGITMRAKRWFRAVSERAEMLLESLASETTLEEEGTGARHAVTLRSAYDRVRILGFAELILSSTQSILQRANALLFRGLGVRMETNSSSPTPYFSATAAGAASTSLRTEGNIDCAQVRVTNPITIPSIGGISGVQDGSENPLLPSGIYEILDDSLELSTETANNRDNFPLGKPLFKHHNEFSPDEGFRSITQSVLHTSPPPTLGAPAFSSITSSDLAFTPGEGSIAPGDDGQHKDYNAEEGQLHEPSTTNEHRNSGNNMVDKSWSFRRIDE